MINADDLPWTALEFALSTHEIERIHIVAVGGALLIVVLALSKGVDRVFFVHVSRADQDAAALVGIGRFRMIVNLSQKSRRYSDHNSFATFVTPPLKRIMVSANSAFGTLAPAGAKVAHKIRLHSLVTRVRIESEIGLPNGPC